ncbi:MAG: hypothetical protein GY851_07660 [bacterium]|nr:hypothetical protein [bacterium]
MRHTLTVLAVLTHVLGASADTEGRWWPHQAVPAAVVCATDYNTYPNLTTADGTVLQGANGPYHMMVQSVAGLAAQAVNEGRHDEMVWINVGENVDYRDWYDRMIGRGRFEVRGTLEPWDLVQRFQAAGVIKGYVLYSHDVPGSGLAHRREGMDPSVNVATTVAGVLGGILVSEELEPKAQELGLEPLFDARGKTPTECFETFKDRLTPRMVCLQDPKAPHCRAMAIAHRTMTLYGLDEPAEDVMAWMEPLSPVLGWGGGDEFRSTVLPSEYGHFQTATNWCLNLPILTAGSEEWVPRRVRPFDPNTIAWDDSRSAIAFIMSDGDNVQWFMGGFYRAQDGWWNSPDRGRFPFGWSCPFTQLTQVCPGGIDYAADAQSAHCRFVEWGGGYYYPDRFAAKRRKRWKLLDAHARRVWANMQATGVRTLGFIMTDVDSDEALKAYQVVANAMPGLLGIFAIQYAPYEGGRGNLFWVPDARGGELPVVCARYSTWSNTNRPWSGTPAKVARLVNEAAANQDEPVYDWAVVHAWSFFKQADDAAGDHDEDMPQDQAWANGGVRGLSTVGWCVDRLSDEVRVADPEELMWRIRMRHDPDRTRSLLD